MATYRYHLWDPARQQVTDTLPLENVTFTAELRGVGACTGTIPLYADGISAARVLAATVPLKTKLLVERDDVLVWAGYVTEPRDYDSATGRLTINAAETLGLLDDRFLPTLSYLGQDQMAIARAIVSTLQAVPDGNLGLALDASLTSGQLRDRAWNAGDRTTGLSALTDLSEMLGGFEFATNVAWNSGGSAPVETLLLGYPKLGRRRTASGMVMEYNRYTAGPASAQPGQVLNYTWSDAPGLFTRCYAQAETSEGVQLVALADNPALRAQGYPLLEQVQTFDAITALAQLQPHADAMKTYAAGHHVTAEFTVVAGPGIEIGDWVLGDDVMTRISDWRFPPNASTGAPGFADYLRITGVSVAPPTPSAPEQYTFTMGDFIENL